MRKLSAFFALDAFKSIEGDSKTKSGAFKIAF